MKLILKKKHTHTHTHHKNKARAVYFCRGTATYFSLDFLQAMKRGRVDGQVSKEEYELQEDDDTEAHPVRLIELMNDLTIHNHLY